jgi:class 3 adenylate cyclase
MAFWGAPEDEPEHAGKAVAAAEDMMRWLEVGNASWQAQFGVTIHLAIGVNSGDAIVGNFGSETRMEYTAIGDAVNVAARLEGIARPQQILISQATMEAAGDDYEYLELGAYKLAGRMEAVNLFEVRV